MYKYDKDELKLNLSIEQVFDLVAELGGEPRMESGFLFLKQYVIIMLEKALINYIIMTILNYLDAILIVGLALIYMNL